MKKWMHIVWMVAALICINACSHPKDNSIKYTPKNVEPTPTPYVEKKSEAPIVEVKKPIDGISPDILYIPSIHVHAKVEPVSVLDNGQMGVPSSIDSIGYLSNGIKPGEIGNVVMDGHVDSRTGPAVFFKLRNLKKDDIIIVKSKDGCKIQFSVQSVEIFKTEDAPIQRIFGTADDAQLNLITCAGKYSRKKKEHEARLVVFAKRSSETKGCKATPNDLSS